MKRLCRHLRWKWRHATRWPTLESLLDHLSGNAVPYTCLLTTHPWGPDDGPATPETCGPHRPCFAPTSEEG